MNFKLPLKNTIRLVGPLGALLLILYSCHHKKENDISLFLTELENSNKTGKFSVSFDFEEGKLNNLHWGGISKIPSSFYLLADLEHIDLSGYELDTLPDFSGFSGLRSLSVLGEYQYLRANSLPTGLRSLTLISQRLRDTLIIDAALPNLDVLNLYYCDLGYIKFKNPETFRSLRSLHLAGNRINHIDPSLYELPALEILNLLRNDTKNVELNRFPELKRIGIEDSLLSVEGLKLISEGEIKKDTMTWFDGRKIF